MPLNTPAQIKAGQIAAFPRTSAPAGWLKANGAAVSRATYAALFLEIGTTYGAGDGSTTFNLPDFRGEFIRGLDDGRGVDTGRTLANLQNHETASHNHSIGNGNVARPVSGGAALYATFDGGVPAQGGTGATGGTETRPRNQALLFCIKY